MLTKVNSNLNASLYLIKKIEAQTGVEIRFHVDSSNWIPEWIRTILKQNVANNYFFK